MKQTFLLVVLVLALCSLACAQQPGFKLSVTQNGMFLLFPFTGSKGPNVSALVAFSLMKSPLILLKTMPFVMIDLCDVLINWGGGGQNRSGVWKASRCCLPAEQVRCWPSFAWPKRWSQRPCHWWHHLGAPKRRPIWHQPARFIYRNQPWFGPYSFDVLIPSLVMLQTFISLLGS